MSRSLKNTLRLVVACLALVFLSQAQAASLNVAVASNFINTAKQLAQGFAQQSGHTLNLSSGSTGKLYTQIINGAPFDVFLAANAREPQRLAQARQALEDSRFTYAVGRLALWSTEPNRVMSDCKTILQESDFKKLAMANPRVAPYGKQTENALVALGLYESLQMRLVMGENIGQAFRFVATGSVPLGIVSLSQIVDPRNPFAGSHCVIDQGLHEPLLQQAVVLLRAVNNPVALEFMTYLHSDPARELIRSYGYALQ